MLEEDFIPHCPLTTPVLFLVFNRPNTTKKAFESIRESQAPKLFVAADGPRPDKPQEKEKCDQVSTVATNVDCELYTLFREENLGCKKAVSSAIDWFFEQVDQGIILEDDYVPHQSFFWFCQELLSRYRYDERIMLISGNNFQLGKERTRCSYYFSRFNHIWGWASWRHAWKLYDVDMSLWPKIRDNGLLNDILDQKEQARYWTEIFENVCQGKIDTW